MFPTPTQLYQSIYKARKSWPPNFSKLTPKHKFSLERRFRRRMKLKFARPRLHQAVRIGQWSTAIYSDVGEGASAVDLVDGADEFEEDRIRIPEGSWRNTAALTQLGPKLQLGAPQHLDGTAVSRQLGWDRRGRYAIAVVGGRCALEFACMSRHESIHSGR
ncbi:hypothetical protein EV426DRAFT_707129 [Tirmania nivea]|nr:hypothetical protein EV426DRAFT_707129 [Tirmania nivea]